MTKAFTYSLCLSALLFASAAYAEDAYKPEIRLTPVLKTTTTSIGQKIEYPRTDNAEVTMYTVELPPGTETGWHQHPVPGYAYVMQGTLTLEIEGGKQLQFSAGQGFAETLNTLHNGRNLGKETVKLLVTFTGEAGKPFAIRK
jgi:quercetin dioxygenase-like cupin family protein